MSFLLNGVELKRPANISRNQIEVAKDHTVLTGEVKRDIVRQKEVFIMQFQMLSTTEVADIINIYNLMRPVSLVVSELSINSTVWVRMQSREYGAKGTDYRENITLMLEEV